LIFENEIMYSRIRALENSSRLDRS